MPKQFFKWLETGARSPLSIGLYNVLPAELKGILQSQLLISSVTQDTYQCDECHEHCVLPVDFADRDISGLSVPYFHCPTGFLCGIQWLSLKDVQGIRFEWPQLKALLAHSVDAEMDDIEPPCIGWHPFARISTKNTYLVLVLESKARQTLKERAFLAKSELNADALVLVMASASWTKSLEASLAAERIYLQSIEAMVSNGCFAIEPTLEKQATDKLKLPQTLVVDCRNQKATYKGHDLKLSGIPLRILAYLGLHAGSAQTFDEIGLEIWGINAVSEMNLEKAIPNHLTTIRQAIKKLSGKKSVKVGSLSQMVIRHNGTLTLNLQPQEVQVMGHSRILNSIDSVLNTI